MERTHTQVRYRQREVKQRNLLKRRRSTYPTNSPRFLAELEGIQNHAEGNHSISQGGNHTIVRNPYKLTSASYGSVQLRKGGRTADTRVVQLPGWSYLGASFA